MEEFSRVGRHSAKLDILETTHTHTHTHTLIQTPGISDQACLLHPADTDKIKSVQPEKKKQRKTEKSIL